jgi:hypothetical protein
VQVVAVSTFREALEIALVDGKHLPPYPPPPSAAHGSQARRCHVAQPIHAAPRCLANDETSVIQALVPLGGTFELGELWVAARQSTHSGVTIVPRMPKPPGVLSIPPRDLVRVLCS